jgi:hypothetical protein
MVVVYGYPASTIVIADPASVKNVAEAKKQLASVADGSPCQLSY